MSHIKYILPSLILLSKSLFACGDNQNAIIHGPFKTKLFDEGTICFQRTIDKRNIDFILNKPINDKLSDIVIERYSYSDGPVEILSVFYAPVKNESNIFVILRWTVNYGVSPTYKYYYEVRAYERSGEKLIVNKLLRTDQKLSGYQMISSGFVSRYELDSAAKVREYIKQNYQ